MKWREYERMVKDNGFKMRKIDKNFAVIYDPHDVRETRHIVMISDPVRQEYVEALRALIQFRK